ncbi:retropepsin-like domain-containing protein [Alkalihalobacillus oceani]|uniref:retropepsin-like aspartic protease n=1 Tax=Halalkalibacter oceani TaxID=1653776 RepID=UPI00203B780D|nr:retropepsin-like aspartic protease [Halalkalibacter oceani]MCM3761998.1 retropepsin-like domain-containing protein [Halalkalibacter oceani]
MKLHYLNGLLHTEFELRYQDKKAVITNIIVDTGAARTLISADAVFDIGIFATPVDELTIMSGIGGDSFAFRKIVDGLSFGTFSISNASIDFGHLDEGFGINGIIGLDILVPGKFIINLDEMYISRK